MVFQITFSRATLAALIEMLLIKRHPNLIPFFIPTSLPLQILSILSVNYTIWLLWIAIIYPFCFHPLRNFPAPRVVILFRLLARIRNRLPPGQLILDIAEKTPNDGIILLQGQATSLVLTKPAPLADLLVHHPYDFAKFDYVRDFLRPVLGDGLVVVEGDRHKFLRKNAQPAFKFSHIKELYPMMWKKAVLFTDVLDRKVKANEGGRVEMNGWASKVTIDIIGIAAFGREFNVLTNPDDPLINNYDELLKPGKTKFLYFLLSATFSRNFVRMLPWKVAQTFEKTTFNIKSICAQLVRDKTEAVAKNADDHFDILSLLIKSNNFSESELVDQLLTFLAAGHETTSSVFTWATYLLAIHPDVREALRQEIQSAFPQFPNVPPGTELSSTLENLPYLNGVLNETLRLYPTVPVTVRVATKDTTLAGYPVQEGSEIVLSPWLVNRYTEIWGPEATKFRPERWTTDGKVNNTGGVASNYAQLTFLHGPRACIGQGFAKAELRCLLAAFAARFDWNLGMKEEDVLPGGVITIRPVNGMWLNLRAPS
ncbi:hypothetical protein OQA88_8377 [Cercophora sp. LCS_1]